MSLQQFINAQREFDNLHGWVPDADNSIDVFRFLQGDVIGLSEEVGEIAGVIKTISLEFRRDSSSLESIIESHLPSIHAELIDVFIYLIRMMDYLKLDVEAVYNEKLALNKERFRHYENSESQ